MNPVLILLLIVLIAAAVLTVGILVCRETEKSIKGTLSECLVWGTGFFLTLSVQVATIATL